MAAIPNPARYCHVHPQDVPMIGSALESIFSPERSVRMLGNGFWRVMRVMCWLKLKVEEKFVFENVVSWFERFLLRDSSVLLVIMKLWNRLFDNMFPQSRPRSWPAS